MKGLLVKEPAKRLGFGPGGSSDVMKHPFFRAVDWGKLEGRGVSVSGGKGGGRGEKGAMCAGVGGEGGRVLCGKSAGGVGVAKVVAKRIPCTGSSNPLPFMPPFATCAQVSSPFRPTLKSAESVENFDRIWTDLPVQDSPAGTPNDGVHALGDMFEGFTYCAPSLLSAGRKGTAAGSVGTGGRGTGQGAGPALKVTGFAA